MKNFPGRSLSEVVNLSADIITNSKKGGYQDYVLNVLIPAAVESIERGENPSDIINGYSLSTVVNCAYIIAYQLDTTGMVDIS